MKQTFRADDGQVFVFVVVGLLVLLLVITAAIVDYGHALTAQHKLQAAAEAAALAGAQALPSTSAAVQAANDYGAQGRNAPSGVVDGSVQQNALTTCSNGSNNCAKPDTVVVKDSADVGTTFAQIVGIDTLHVHAQAAACRGCAGIAPGTAKCTNGASSISSSFSSTPIPTGNTIWLSSVLDASNVPSAGATIRFSGQTFTFNGQTVNVPDGVVIFSPSVTTPSTTYNTGSNTWETTVPVGTTGDVFLSGTLVPVTADVPGGVSPVTWQGTFATDNSNASVTWHWGAAVYNDFASDDGSVNVNPVASNYPAGTPVDYIDEITGGGRNN
ncbi:MAG: hypothetical protein JO017_01190 [Actinobacteria bacterium]|nr:hypothetical protein [Actinomycetota bacterium]